VEAKGLSSPFLHWSWEHIEGDSGPLFIFGFLSAYRGVAKFLGVTGLIIVVGGLGAWFTSQPMSVGAGAGGVVFGYFGYVLVRGAFDRHLIDIVVGVVMALCFAYQFAGLLPQEGIGRQAHVFGFLGGLLGGWLFRDRARPRPATASPDPNPRAALLKNWTISGSETAGHRPDEPSGGADDARVLRQEPVGIDHVPRAPKPNIRPLCSGIRSPGEKSDRNMPYAKFSPCGWPMLGMGCRQFGIRTRAHDEQAYLLTRPTPDMGHICRFYRLLCV
jgi:hypothetical protein